MVDKQTLRDAMKKKDGWWASRFSGPIANIFLYFIAERKWITPNCITSSSLLVCVVSCILISTGITHFLFLSAVLIQLVFILDCLDGQLARYRNESSNFGAWYDRVTDRVKDFLIYFSIAWGHFRTYQDWKIWPLAMTSLFFVYLFDYYVNQDIKLEAVKRVDEVEKKSKCPMTMSLNFLFSLGEKIYKSVPLLQFHIGEQYLLISIFLTFNQTRLLFYLIILLGVFYSVYWPVSKYFGRKPV
ncbi:MAG: CDP-alcohol phosphatidyltransferase family protein [Candidatus Melainabacteria bacterium]|nr:CDP-alcohol phosphatidyltransferase family protein [Candidatus Melainabacteria bacterium]